MAVWNLYQTCKAFGQRPSAMFGIEDEWLEWDFDHAILFAGKWVEARLEERDKDGRAVYKTLREALNLPKEPMTIKPVSKQMLLMLAGDDAD